MKYSDFLQQHSPGNTKEDVRAIRLESGLTQKGFEEKYGVPRRTLQDWEAGKREAPGYVVALLAYAVKSDNE